MSVLIAASIALKAEGKLLRGLWGDVAQRSEHLKLKKEALGLIPGSYPFFVLYCFFVFFPAGLLM